jgi:hypothetical protein
VALSIASDVSPTIETTVEIFTRCSDRRRHMLWPTSNCGGSDLASSVPYISQSPLQFPLHLPVFTEPSDHASTPPGFGPRRRPGHEPDRITVDRYRLMAMRRHWRPAMCSSCL